MSAFVDRLLIQIADPAQLLKIIDTAGDASRTNLRALLNTMYDLQFAKVHDILQVQVNGIEFQQLLLPTHRKQGTWMQTQPTHTRTDVLYEGSETLEPLWVDISAELILTLLLEIDSGEVETILNKNIDSFNTIDEFQAALPFMNVAAFMAEHHIATVEELREKFKYLSTEIRLQQPPQFDPANPANQRKYALNLAILIRDAIDIAATLRDIKLVNAVFASLQDAKKEFEGNEVLSSRAPVVLLPEAPPGGLPFDEKKIQAVFSNEGVLALFVNPL